MIIDNVNFNVELLDILIELKQQLSANNIELIQKYKEGPKDIQICCPYHANGKERRPSAGIRKDDGLFHCFACNEIHTLPEVVSYCFGYDDFGKFGWQWLLKNFATVQVEERKDVELDFTRSGVNATNIYNKKSSRVDERDKDDISRYVSESELAGYRYIHRYMYQRGLTDAIIEMFDIGYDITNQSITFPIKDIEGNVLFIARRSVNTKYFNYPSGVEKPLYGLYEYLIYGWEEVNDKKCWDDVVVTESMFDALSFWTIGRCAVALNGLGNELQFKQLRELPCRKIILATDMDERGLAARKRIRQNMRNTKIITEYYFPKGRKDANECTKEELQNLVEVF